MNETRGQVIDYLKLYEQLKDKPAKTIDRDFRIFKKLFDWREHEKEREMAK
ncbi:hypothetical protein [Thermaerobacillus caldiproteolyticus]|uniref:hypothetical protein n=1 Tax=Thermaerobacillus caldiproteolyticus TaxID=247480 RepID=UPI00188D0550|nr:hypothetical protein [Anoxybacillus caldiproteolyticus]QPA33408.1 hypothetical protein ISX45_18985 [Anoxybacillus caldiproteolyticus]